MHIEFLVEDQSGKRALEHLLPKIVGDQCTYNIHPYKGIGHLPKNLNPSGDPQKRVLLQQLPRLLRGYGNAFNNYPPGYRAAVIVVCDLDDRDENDFLKSLEDILMSCDPAPEAYFIFAIEEGEAWLLGDKDAVRAAYPRARSSVLNSYVYDSICGTWELLADSVYPGGAQSLKSKGKPEVGRMKSVWAEEISPHVDVEENRSPSFAKFKDTIQNICLPQENN